MKRSIQSSASQQGHSSLSPSVPGSSPWSAGWGTDLEWAAGYIPPAAVPMVQLVQLVRHRMDLVPLSKCKVKILNIIHYLFICFSFFSFFMPLVLLISFYVLSQVKVYFIPLYFNAYFNSSTNGAPPRMAFLRWSVNILLTDFFLCSLLS